MICPSPLVYFDINATYSLGTKIFVAYDNCAVPCPNLAYTDEEWKTLNIVIGCVCAVAFVSSSLCLLGHIFEIKRFYILVMFISGFTVYSMILGVFFLLNINDSIICKNDSAYIEQGPICVIQAACLVFLFVWIESWSVMIAFDTLFYIYYNSGVIVKPWWLSDIKTFRNAYTIICIFFSSLITSIPLIANDLGYDPRANIPICFFIGTATSTSKYFWLAFFFPFYFLLLVFISITIIGMFKINQIFISSLPYHNSDSVDDLRKCDADNSNKRCSIHVSSDNINLRFSSVDDTIVSSKHGNDILEPLITVSNSSNCQHEWAMSMASHATDDSYHHTSTFALDMQDSSAIYQQHHHHQQNSDYNQFALRHILSSNSLIEHDAVEGCSTRGNSIAGKSSEITSSSYNDHNTVSNNHNNTEHQKENYSNDNNDNNVYNDNNDNKSKYSSWKDILFAVFRYNGRSLIFILIFGISTIALCPVVIDNYYFNYKNYIDSGDLFINCLVDASLACATQTQEGVDECARSSCGTVPSDRPGLPQLFSILIWVSGFGLIPAFVYGIPAIPYCSSKNK